MKSQLLQKTAEVQRVPGGGLVVDIKTPEYSTYRTASGANLGRVLQRLDSSVDFLLITSFRIFENESNRLIPMKENVASFRTIPGALRATFGTHNIGAYWLIGHWSECYVGTDPLDVPLAECTLNGGDIRDSLEYSWLLTKDDEDITSEEWLAASEKLGAKHNQNSFIIRIGGETTLRTPDGTIYKHLRSDSAIVDAWGHLAKVRGTDSGVAYSEVRKQRARGRLQPLVFRDKPAPEADGTEEGSPETLKASSYRVRGTGKPYGIEFFVACPHNISGSRMFQIGGIRHQEPRVRS